jgi:hypothetical protein
MGSTKTESDDFHSINAGLFWFNSKSVSTTQIVKVQTSLQQWSLESGMSKNSFDGGLSFPIGKVSIGTKFGSERERSNSARKEKSETHFTALHIIPAAQINLNETTVLLSPDAERDIKKLRKERKFIDLLTFLDKYGSSRRSSARALIDKLMTTGTFVYQNTTLGGRLYHTQDFSLDKEGSESEKLERFKKSANASLGVPDLIQFKIGGSSEKGSSQSGGTETVQTSENLTWSGIGGNVTLSIE